MSLKEKFYRLRKHELYQRVFDSPEGREVLKDLCRRGHVGDSTFVAGDTHLTAMREGERRMALSIVKYVYKEHASFINDFVTGIEQEELEDARNI